MGLVLGDVDPEGAHAMSRYVWGTLAGLLAFYSIWRGTNTLELPGLYYGSVSCGSPWSPNTISPATSGMYSSVFSKTCDSWNSGGLMVSIIAIAFAVGCALLSARAARRNRTAAARASRAVA
jgi:hypothetical protein